MCGGGSILKTIASVAAPVLGTALGGPLGGALGGGIGSAIGGGSVGQDILGAGLGGIGGALSGTTGSLVSPDSIFSDVNGAINGIGGDVSSGLSNLYQAAGSPFSGIGSDIGNAASTGWNNFANSTGLADFLGGTAQPGTDLTADYNAFSNNPGSIDVASAAASPTSSGLTGVLPSSGTVGAAGGGNLTGFGDFGAGTSNGLSSTAVGQSGGALGDVSGNDFSAFNTSTPASSIPISNLDTSALSSSTQNPGSLLNGQSNPLAGLDAGIGGTQNTSGLSNLVNSALGSPNVPNGSFNYDINGSPVGASALSTSNPNYLATSSGGDNVGLLSSLFGGGSNGTTGASTSSAGMNVLNGLLRGGLGYLFNQPNTAGANAINSATQQAESQFAPYLQAGAGAENTLANLYGTNGSAAQTAAQQNFANTPGYQFALNQGINAVNANAAAMGNPLSGNNQQAVNNYAQGTANQTYNNYVNQLQNLASGGMSAAGGAGTAGLTGANAISQLDQNKANAANTAVGTGLSALFPSGGINLAQLLGGQGSGGAGTQGLLSLFGY